MIGLPPKLFSTTGIPVAILVFDRSREEGGANEDRFDILFIDASREFTAGKKQNVMEEEHLAKVVETYRKREAIERYSHVATPDEIVENDYNLNIPRYVDTFEPEEEIDIAEVQREIDRIEAELVVVRAKMRGYLRELRGGGVGEEPDRPSRSRRGVHHRVQAVAPVRPGAGRSAHSRTLPEGRSCSVSKTTARFEVSRGTTA